MRLRELLSLTDLLRAQTLYIHKTIEVIIVRKNENLMLAAFQVVVPYLKHFDNSQKLTIVNLILCFRWNYFPKKNATKCH